MEVIDRDGRPHLSNKAVKTVGLFQVSAKGLDLLFGEEAVCGRFRASPLFFIELIIARYQLFVRDKGPLPFFMELLKAYAAPIRIVFREGVYLIEFHVGVWLRISHSLAFVISRHSFGLMYLLPTDQIPRLAFFASASTWRYGSILKFFGGFPL
jgi:hypothetical protein